MGKYHSALLSKRGVWYTARMVPLRNAIQEAQARQRALGHFNVSDLVAVKAIVQAAKSLNVPVIIGVSEGERKFLGVKTIAAVVKSLREELSHDLYLNADHTKSLEGIKEAVEAGFDAVIFDGSKLAFKENVEKTRQAVEYAKSANPNVLVEGELGYIGESSKVLDQLPEGVDVSLKSLPTPEQAQEFVQQTKVDLFAPAVGNVHGMLKDTADPALYIELIRKVKEATGVPLVLHGGSGNTDEDFTKAIDAGIAIIHINTQIRRAWRDALLHSLAANTQETTPYHLLEPVLQSVQELVAQRLKLFSRIGENP